MKFLEILLFELDYRLRRVSTWVFLAAMIGLAFSAVTGMLVEEAERAGDQYVNGPGGLAAANIIISMMSLVIPAALFSGAALRDVETRMHPLFATSPITKTEYLGGRFAGALVVNALLVTAVPVALMLFTQPSFVDPDLLGPFRPAAYLRPYLLVLLPNLFFTGALFFAVATLTRRSLPVFATGAFLFLASVLMEEVVAEQLGRGELAALLEPFGFSALSELWEFWTPYEKNTRMLAAEGALLWNRLLWLGAGALILAFTRFRFRIDLHHARAGRRRIVELADAKTAPVRLAPHIAPSFDAATRVRQMLAISGETFRELVLTRDFMLIGAGLAAMVLLLGVTALGDDYGTPFFRLTQFVAPFLGGFVPAFAISLLTALYAGELVHRERDAGLGDIADANPVPDWVLFAGKFAALALMLVPLQTLLMASGVLLQLTGGIFDLQLGLYLKIVYGLQLVDYLLFAALAMLVHVLVNHKYFGHLLVVLCYLFTLFAPRLGLEHNMLVYGRDPGWVYSDISGFGPFIGPLLWFKLYWTGWAILLAVLSNLLWVRGRDRGLRKRLALARIRFGRGAAIATIFGVLLSAGAGGYVYYNTNVLTDYRTAAEAAGLQAEYERRYGKYENDAQPTVTETKLHVEIYPERRQVHVRGTYALLNATAQPIRTLHLYLSAETENRAVAFDRPNSLRIADAELGHRTYELQQALEPGQSLQMTFDVRFQPRGFPNSDINTSVVRNGTYFDHTGGRNPNHRRWLPLVGYQPNRELSVARDRRVHGLPARPVAPLIDDLGSGQGSAGRESILFEAVIGTSAE
ncbi:MAG TPA: ABC transporter permease, partial [Thermoanaerobaculia bacterium]|nr:ABC transporter permease [Thermoanaerobaculia bacterium]